MNENELKSTINHMYLRLAFLSAQQETLTDMVFGVFGEMMQPDEIKSVSKRFCELLAENLKQAEKDISEIVSDVAMVARWHLTNCEYVRCQKELYNVD